MRASCLARVGEQVAFGVGDAQLAPALHLHRRLRRDLARVGRLALGQRDVAGVVAPRAELACLAVGVALARGQVAAGAVLRALAARSCTLGLGREARTGFAALAIGAAAAARGSARGLGREARRDLAALAVGAAAAARGLALARVARRRHALVGLTAAACLLARVASHLGGTTHWTRCSCRLRHAVASHLGGTTHLPSLQLPPLASQLSFAHVMMHAVSSQ